MHAKRTRDRKKQLLELSESMIGNMESESHALREYLVSLKLLSVEEAEKSEERATESKKELAALKVNINSSGRGVHHHLIISTVHKLNLFYSFFSSFLVFFSSRHPRTSMTSMATMMTMTTTLMTTMVTGMMSTTVLYQAAMITRRALGVVPITATTPSTETRQETVQQALAAITAAATTFLLPRVLLALTTAAAQVLEVAVTPQP